MSNQIGRISGPLLKDDLLRNGVDLAFETDLLYFDVVNQRVGVRTSSPTRGLNINGSMFTTNLLVDNLLTIGNVQLSGSSAITTLVDELNIVANQTIIPRFGAGNIEIDNNKIYNIVTNSPIVFRADGTGQIEIFSNVEVFGNLHATGNVTMDGNITLGTDDDDSIIFNTDVNSNIIPAYDGVYNLGDQPHYKRWQNIYAGFLNGQVIETESVVPGTGIEFQYRQGNIWYVSANGHYDNVGNHPNGPFDSIELALKNAKYGDTVFVFPGVYDELLPLTVPAGVTVKGTDLRNTIIKPDTASEFEDVFLLNEDTTISDLTIKDFYFNSVNNKGYAFKFAPNIKINQRSPYIQNVTVITKGSAASPIDPLGFSSADAGKGAYLDGNVANVETNQPSMMFYSVTFITPNVDSLTAINDTRIEWIRCFTYYANRGIYLLRGTGRTLQDGSSKKYGAEVRSSGSTNIYGNYGVIADGLDTKIHITNHNFMYVGSGADSTNNPVLTIQANEIVEINNGVIEYTSLDQFGSWRIGDVFEVNLSSSLTNIANVSPLEGNNVIDVILDDSVNQCYINSDRIDIGNILINENNFTSTAGPINVSSATNEINLNKDVFITKNLSVSNNVNIDGTLRLGNQDVDSIVIFPKIDQDINPDTNVSFNLGSIAKNWKDAYIRHVYISDIEINTNYITTNISNADLELSGNGTGGVLTETLRFRNNTIESALVNQNIEVALTGSSILDIITDTAIKIPVGTTANKPSLLQSELRFTTTDSLFEGFTTAKVSFGGIFSEDRLTYAQADPVSNVINFVTQGITTLEVSPTKFNVSGLLIDGISINNNIINTNNTDLNFTTGGNLNLEDLQINNNIITNAVSNSNTIFAHTGEAYLKIGGTIGFRIPAGTDAERPGSPDDGTLRWSDTQNYLEVYMNTQWGMANGPGGFATAEEVDEISNLYNLILG